MKPLGELDHYEVLEVAPDASPEEVERAYRVVRAAYADGSLGTYSVFDTDESATLRERVEAAYRVLSDPEARRAYDAAHRTTPDEPAPAPLRFEPVGSAAGEAPATSFDVFEESEEADANAEWDGARLRRARLMRAVELRQIAHLTKINPTYLRFLEEERFEDLPAPVYVRGFVTAYAQSLGLDARRVAGSYMHRFLARRGRPKLPGIFGAP